MVPARFALSLGRPLLASVFAVSLLGGLACDDKPSAAEALEKTKEKDKAEKEAKAKAEAEAAKKAKEKKEGALENPWTFDSVKASLTMGSKVTYAVSGVDAKGKEVTDEFWGEVKGNRPEEVAVTKTLASAKDTPQATQVARLPWDKSSPFFPVEKAEVTLVGPESVTVPAGTFECVKAEVKGFFGAHLTVWMAKDKPGIYAKVEDHGNANDEEDQTAMVYELATHEAGA